MSDLKLTTLVTALERAVKNSDNDVATTIEQRVEIMSKLIGAVIGSWLAIPATVTKNRDMFYVTQVYPQVVNVVNVLIESFQFNVDVALDCCKSIWTYRYDLVHDVNSDFIRLLDNLSYIIHRSGTEEDIETHLNLTRILSGSEKNNISVAISNLRNYLKEEGVV